MEKVIILYASQPVQYNNAALSFSRYFFAQQTFQVKNALYQRNN